MIICSAHWEQLHRLECERGLGHLMHQPHDEFEAFAADLCGRRYVPVAFDPMVEARDTAEGLALAYGGQYVNRPSPAGAARCSVCELINCGFATAASNDLSSDEFWPDAIVTVVVCHARRRGLMPRPA